jgi:ATP-dependent RNA helicase RhlE
VINFEIPEQPETYVHRIGRTGRAGSTGIAMSFCTREEMGSLRDINKLIKKNIDVVAAHPYC